jgi:hypothetical protein
MRHLIKAVYVLSMFTSRPVFAQDNNTLTHRFLDGKSARGIPFELNSNKIYLTVKIDGSEPRPFILDSGCPVTAIEMTVARALKLPLANERNITGAGEGSAEFATTEIKSLTFPGLDLFPKAVWALGVNKPVSPFEGRRIDGLIGVDFLERFIVRIDYPNRKIDVLSADEPAPVAGGIVIQLEKNGGHYTTKATLRLKNGESYEGTFIVDVGVRAPLIAATPFVNRNHLIDATKAGPMQSFGGGIGGETRGHPARIEALAIGELRVSKPFIALSQEKKSFLAGDDVQGLIGAEIFRRYVLTMDLPHHRMILAETPESKAPYEFDMSGMFLTAGGDGFHKFNVLSVVEGGPAATAGIQPGDIIAELDGTPAAKLTLEQLRSTLCEAGATRSVVIVRSDGRHTVKVQLRRLV